MPTDLRLAPDALRRAAERALGADSEVDVDASVLSYVSHHAARTPDQPAVVDGATMLSYPDLLARVAQIRTLLSAEGCRAGDVVATVGSRSADAIATVLALESLGAVYLPVSRDWPTERVKDVLSLGSARFLLHYCQNENPACLAEEAAARLADIPVFQMSCQTEPLSGALSEPVGPRGPEPRYCIFTSGTTGRPKGVLVEHRGMMNHLWAKVDALSLTGDDRLAFTAPLGFVISIWQMLAPLLVGGTVVVARDDRLVSPRRLTDFVDSTDVAVAELVPTMLTWIADRAVQPDGPRLLRLRWLVSTGEELPAELAQRVRAAMPHVRLLNAYGSTECSDDVTHHEITEADPAGRVPIGSPIDNVRLYLLSRAEDGDTWSATEPGGIGELFVGGLAVCRGYVAQAPGRAPVVFEDPIDPASPTGRLYRTGDLARFEDGVVHYVGRTDRQVKIAGVRMELDEIDSVLRRHTSVVASATVVTEQNERRRLAVFFTADQPVDTEELRAHLKARLPAAMVPDHLIQLLAFPTSSNGKTDYHSLRRILGDRLAAPSGA